MTYSLMSLEREKSSWGRGFYERLVRTGATHPARRVDGRMLAVALLVVLAMVAVSVPIMLAAARAPAVRIAILVPAFFGSLALLSAYIINRRGHIQTGAHVFVMSVAVFSAVYLGFSPTSAFSGNAWMLIPVIVAAFFLGTQWTLVYGGLVLIALVWGIVSAEGTPLQLQQALVGMLLPALLILLLARGRDMHRQELEAASNGLRDEQANLKAVFRATPDAVFTLDVDGDIVHYNGPARRLASRAGTDGDLSGLPLLDVLPPLLARTVREQLPRVQGGGRFLAELQMVGEGEEWARESTGMETCEIVMAPVRVEDKIVGALLEVRDISGLRRREREAATEVEEAKRAILNMAAHELNTPMTPILIELQALEARLGEDRANRPAINRIRRNLDRLSDSIEQMVDLALAKDGNLPLRLEPVPFGQVADAGLQRLRGAFKAKDIYVQVDGGTGPTIFIDRDRVRRALMNILENAIENSPRGNTVYMSWYELPGGQLICKVRDEGIGFQPGVEPEIFESFQALRDTVERGAGKPGLGLAMTKAIIEAHGGMIGASTEGPGHGAQFSFILPVDPRRRRFGPAQFLEVDKEKAWFHGWQAGSHGATRPQVMAERSDEETKAQKEELQAVRPPRKREAPDPGVLTKDRRR